MLVGAGPVLVATGVRTASAVGTAGWDTGTGVSAGRAFSCTGAVAVWGVGVTVGVPPPPPPQATEIKLATNITIKIFQMGFILHL